MKKLVLAATLLGAVTFPQIASAATVTFPDFSDVSAWKLNGSAATSGMGSSAVLRVTPANFSRSGSAFLTNAISLQNEASFSAFFQFRISNPGGLTDTDGVRGADGIVFTIQNVTNTAGGAGDGIGYRGLSPSLGVEFDTFNNGSVDQNNGNHIGININGNIASNPLVPVTPVLNNGTIYSAWVDYNGLTDNLQVRFSNTNTRPATPLISTTVDLLSILGQDTAFVGFTSGTGNAFNDHDILNFTFTDSFDPIDPAGTPEPSTFLGLVSLGIFAVTSSMRRREIP